MSMWSKLKALFWPPYLDQHGNMQMASVLQSVLLLMGIGIASAALIAGFTMQSPLWLWTYGFLLAVIGLCWAVLKRGYVRMSALLLAVSFWGVTTFVLYYWQSAFSPSATAYVLVMIFAAFMLSRLYMLLFAALSIAAVLALHVANVNGLLPDAAWTLTSADYTAHTVSYILLAALLLMVSVTLGRRMMGHLESTETKLQTTVGHFEQHSQYFDSILRSMSNLLIVVDQYNNITTVNRAAAVLLGYTERELIGMPFASVCELKDKHLNPQADSDEITHSSDYTMITRDGHFVPVSLTMSLMHDNGSGMQGIVIVGQDLSQMKASEQERLRSAMRYRALFEQSNDAIFLVGVDGKTIAVNRRASELLGYTSEELTRMDWTDIIAPSEREQARQMFTRVISGEPLPLYERKLLRKDGTEISVETNVELVRDSNGQPLHIQSIMRDITERKRTETQLAYQARLMEIVSDAIISTDMDNVIVSWNRAAQQVYGWKAEEVIGRKLTEVVPTEFDNGGEDFIKEQYFNRGHWQSELVQYRRDGKPLNILSSVSLIRDSNTRQIYGVVAVNHNITHRKRMEAELEKRVLQFKLLRQIDIELTSTLSVEAVTNIALNAAAALTEADAGFIMLNDAGETRIVEVMGDYDGVMHKGTVQPYGAFGRVYRTLQAELVPDVDADPDYIRLLPNVKSQIVIPLISQNRFIGILDLETNDPDRFTTETFEYLNLLTSRVAVALDNARLYEMSQQQVIELQTLFQRVSSIEQLKTDMIRIASHDLRNPIGIIKGYLSLSDEDIVPQLDEGLKIYFTGMWEAVNRMENITESILSLERIEQIAKNDIHEPIDMRHMVRRVLFENERAAESKHIRLSSNLPDDALVLLADPAQLHEAVFNLVENAIKYTPEGGTVSVTLGRDGDEAVFTVQDSGYGIPAEQQEKLFSPGFRAQSDETQNIDGTGWGLYLVKGIVERHGGEMIFHSVYRKGSTFGFRLPPEPRPKRRKPARSVHSDGHSTKADNDGAVSLF